MDDRTAVGPSVDERTAVAALASLPGLGPAALGRLLALGRPAHVWSRLVSGDATTLAAAGREKPPEPHHAELARRRLDACKATVLLPGDSSWPCRLEDDPDPPAALFASGPVPDGPSVALVGTRRCSAYGRRVATMLGADLAAAGVVVVSGVATGIDATAQRAALDSAHAPVIGVVGSGLDVVYPPGNRRLWNDLAERGTLLSECAPGAQPLPWRFPLRNRIIAALADVVVVVESGAAGGSMHTVEAAQERDRPVMAVPGPITSPSSAGTNRLLADGCAPVCDVDDVLVALGLWRAGRGPVEVVEVPSADADLLDDMGWDPVTVDELVLRGNRNLGEVTAGLARLATAGRIRDAGGWWERVR
jgi:DNA processing protein